MTHVNPFGFVEHDSEIKWKIYRNIEIEDRESSTKPGQQRTLSDYGRPQFIGEEFSVQAPAVNAINFDLARHIGMIHNTVQFDGLVDEDPNEHLSRFLQNMRYVHHEWSLKWYDQTPVVSI